MVAPRGSDPRKERSLSVSRRPRTLGMFLVAAACAGSCRAAPSQSPSRPAATNEKDAPLNPTDSSQLNAHASVTLVPMPQFDALLDVLPDAAGTFAIVTDPAAMTAIGTAVMSPLQPAVATLERRLASAKAGRSTEVFDQWSAFERVMADPALELSQGVLVASVDGHDVVIYRAATPDTLPQRLEAAGLKAADSVAACRPLTAGGWHACADASATLDKLAPGRRGDEVRRELSRRFGADVASATAISQLERKQDANVYAVATARGRELHVSLSLEGKALEDVRVFGHGPADALTRANVAEGFYWGRFDPAQMKQERASSSEVTAALLESFTGEFFGGTVGPAPGFGILIGLANPDPVSGTMTLLGGQLASIKDALGPELGMNLQMESIEVAGVERPLLHVEWKLSAAQRKVYRKYGIAPHLWLFVAPEYGGLVMGIERQALETWLAQPVRPSGPSSLPDAFVSSLAAAEVSAAVHLSLDALQSPASLEAWGALAGQAKAWPGLEMLVGESSPREWMELGIGLLQPFSSMSVWIRPTADQVRLDVAVTVWTDPSTPEGKAAVAAFARPRSLSARTEAYKKLARQYPASPQSAGFEVRASRTQAHPWLGASAVLGVLAEITIKGISRYLEKARQSNSVGGTGT